MVVFDVPYVRQRTAARCMPACAEMIALNAQQCGEILPQEGSIAHAPPDRRDWNDDKDGMRYDQLARALRCIGFRAQYTRIATRAQLQSPLETGTPFIANTQYETNHA